MNSIKNPLILHRMIQSVLHYIEPFASNMLLTLDRYK